MLNLKLLNFKQIGPQLGSNPGGQYEDRTGKRYYVKFSPTKAHAENEVLAARLYALAGVPTLNPKLALISNGSYGVITEWQSVEAKFDRTNPSHVAQVRENFAVHAWLANWDAIGLEYDNQAVIDGRMTTLDVGGALKYRAQGARKDFGATVPELTTMRNPAYPSGQVFRCMSQTELHLSAFKLQGFSEASMVQAVWSVLSTPSTSRSALTANLQARREFIVNALIKGGSI